MDKPMTFIEWCAGKGVIPYSLGIEAAYEAGQQSMQAKVEELQTQLSLQRQRVKAFEEELTSSRNYGDELQKRVDAATKQAQNALQYVEEDMRGNHEFLQMAMIRTFKALEQALKGKKNES
ncbi:hypothetical protein QM274_02920 [Acinetobacter baumannii]|nr:hypothetical protein [Acinetobacter baumannii]MDI9751194.1 hypothetical protein [Acinetobacter baumannii]